MDEDPTGINSAINVTGKNRTRSWVDRDSLIATSMKQRIKTLEAPYYLLVISICFFFSSMKGLEDHAYAYFVYKFGYWDSINKIDVSGIA